MSRTLRDALTLTPLPLTRPALDPSPARATDTAALQADITEGWDVRGIPHGGYLLALVSEAMQSAVPQPHPLSVSATYLAAPSFGPAELYVETVKIGKRQSTAAVRLVQNGVERVRAVGTYGELPVTAVEHPAGAIPPPVLPPPEDCLSSSVLAVAEGEPVNLHDQLVLRLDPATGWLNDRFGGPAELNGWMCLGDGSDPDPAALLVFSDGMPPSLFETFGRTLGHVPTVQLTTHLFALPSPGWVSGSFRTRVTNGSLVDEDGEVWDGAGRLVATTRQLALITVPR
ncbi:MAG: thioesterase family protein [Actinomycetota bacterium]|nr:thioesterase family protein [Actinomycetota bacterium]